MPASASTASRAKRRTMRSSFRPGAFLQLHRPPMVGSLMERPEGARSAPAVTSIEQLPGQQLGLPEGAGPLDPIGDAVGLPQQGVARQAQGLLPELPGVVDVAEQVRLAAQPVTV